MKQVGFAARLLAIVAVLSLAAFVVTGCGDDKSGSGSSDTASGNGDTASGETKQYDEGDTVGEAKKVEVDSDQEFSAEQQAVIARVGEFGDATADQNYKKLCNDILSKASRKIGNGDCEGTFEETGAQLKDFKITVKSVKVASDGKTATAVVDVTSNVQKAQQEQTLSLIKEGGEWRIQILGQ